MTQLLEHDTYRRDAWPPLPGAKRRGRDAFVFGTLMAAALAMVVATKFEAPAVALLRATLQDAAAPAMRSAALLLAPAINLGRTLAEWQTLADERNRLREENDRLKGWEARGRALERQAAALADVTRMVEASQLGFVTARVITGTGGSFVRAALVDAGRSSGIKPGYPVMSAQGLAGRIIAAGQTSARILLVTDYNSRIPVVIGAGAVRAVMQGDNGPLPRIAYLPPDSRVQPGDDVFTSGVGGLFPRGLRVGAVVDTGETLRIEPSARLDRLDYISVLFSESLSALLADEERALEARASGGANGTRRVGPAWPTSAEGGLAR
jgi:rod shape-determining protein MreC